MAACKADQHCDGYTHIYTHWQSHILTLTFVRYKLRKVYTCWETFCGHILQRLSQEKFFFFWLILLNLNCCKSSLCDLTWKLTHTHTHTDAETYIYIHTHIRWPFSNGLFVVKHLSFNPGHNLNLDPLAWSTLCNRKSRLYCQHSHTHTYTWLWLWLYTFFDHFAHDVLWSCWHFKCLFICLLKRATAEQLPHRR